MKNIYRQVLVLSTLFVSCAAVSAFALEDKETIRKSFPAAARLEVDNVSGFVHITGYSGSEVQMVVERKVVADTQEQINAGKTEVKLDTKQTGDTLTFYVDTPGRCNCDSSRNSVHEHAHRHYHVTYDFDIKVPAAMALEIGTVNEGDVRIENTTGDFDIGNVNGAIEMREVAGSGLVHTVNGKITTLFTKNPSKPTSFKTVNGTIEASFRPGLAADVRIKTFNGSAYTDFESTALAQDTPVVEHGGGKFKFRSDRFTALRIGSGGPELKFDTLNGSIRIINRGK